MSSRSSITSENSVDQDNSDIETETAKISPADDDAIKDEDTKKQKTQKNKKKKKKKKKKKPIQELMSDDRDFYEPIPVCELKQIAQNCSKKLEVNPSVLRAASYELCIKSYRPLDDEYIDKPVKHTELLVEPEEWMCLNPNRLGIYQSGPPSEEQAPKKSRRLSQFAPPHHKRDEPLKQKYETEKNMLGSQKTTSYDKSPRRKF